MVQIVAGGLIAHVAVTGIFKDPVMKYPVSLLEKVWGFQLNEWINFIALDAAIFLILAGFMIKARNRA
ncbi:Integral membrane protein TerC [Heyndrickxia coagulans 2-6]|nr:Integral membrane protein TerC [Heyndrickxia coagulans 2-6]